MDDIKQAVILAGGRSSRFQPLSANRHKAEIPLLGKTILNRTVESLVACRISNIVVVHSPKRVPVVEQTDDAQITYVMQPEPRGMGNAMLCALEHLEDVFLVIHSYHLDCNLFLSRMIKQLAGNDGVMLLTKGVKGKVGIAEYRGGRVRSIREEPYQGEKETHNISGTYILTKEYIKVLKKQKEHHYNFEAALDEFAKDYNLGAYIIDHKLLTFKYPWHLFDIKDYLLQSIDSFFHPAATIHKTAMLENKVYIDEGAKIGAYSVIKGPTYIGREVFVGDHVLIRGGSTVEASTVIGAYTELKNSIVLEDVHIQGYVADSILGKNVRGGHGLITANRRFDRRIMEVKVKDKLVDTGRSFLGAIVGDDASLGVGVRTMPGVVIGENSIIGPGTVVFKNIPPDSRYYKRCLSKPKTKNKKPKTQT